MGKHMIRIHRARMETSYGVDTAQILDDPIAPKYSYDEVINRLMDALGYTPNDNNDSCEYPGFFDGGIGAYFDYDGYIDVEVPNSITERISRDKE